MVYMLFRWTSEVLGGTIDIDWSTYIDRRGHTRRGSLAHKYSVCVHRAKCLFALAPCKDARQLFGFVQVERAGEKVDLFVQSLQIFMN
jgi:hypothetical protein